MPAEDKMTLDERCKYLKVMKPRYVKAKRGERSRLLTEMEQVTGMYRKSLIRLMFARSLESKQRVRQRRRSYGVEVERIVLIVWESLDYVCAEQLTSVPLATTQRLAHFGVVSLTPELEAQLASISEATVECFLRKNRAPPGPPASQGTGASQCSPQGGTDGPPGISKSQATLK